MYCTLYMHAVGGKLHVLHRRPPECARLGEIYKGMNYLRKCPQNADSYIHILCHWMLQRYTACHQTSLAYLPGFARKTFRIAVMLCYYCYNCVTIKVTNDYQHQSEGTRLHQHRVKLLTPIPCFWPCNYPMVHVSSRIGVN